MGVGGCEKDGGFSLLFKGMAWKFCSHYIGHMVTWSRLLAKEAGKCGLYSGHMSSYNSWKKGRMDTGNQTVISATQR